jgi:hypothetical protein
MTVSCQWGVCEWVWSIGGMILTGRKRKYSQQPAPMSLCPPQTLHVLPYNHFSGASPLRGQELTARAMACLPAGFVCYVLNIIFHACVMPYCYKNSTCWFCKSLYAAFMWDIICCQKNIYYRLLLFLVYFLVTGFYFNHMLRASWSLAYEFRNSIKWIVTKIVMVL